MPPFSVPTTTALPSSSLIPATHPSVIKTLHRLSRPSLLSLILDWLDERQQEYTAPYLADEDYFPPTDADDEADKLYPPASSLSDIREIYSDLQARKGSKRDVLDRVLEGDWRRGISLYQLAMADMQYLYDHPASQKWSALKIVPLSSDKAEAKEETTTIPRFHPTTFLQNLRRECLPDVKAHYNLDKHPTLAMHILRIYIIDSPYNTSLALQPSKRKTEHFDASKTFYVAFPFSSPHIFVSLTTTTVSTTPNQGSISDNRSLRRLTLEGIPKAFSRPRERYRLESTGLSARNLDALCERRGGGRTNAAAGGWGVYAEKEMGREGENPLDLEAKMNTQLLSPDPTPSVGEDGDTAQAKEKEKLGMKRKRVEDESVIKRRNLIASGRFGNTAKPNDGKGIERFDVRIEDPFPSSSSPSKSKPLFGEVVPEDDPALTNAATKKRKGRRSTISLELEKRDTDEVERDGDGDSEWRPDIRITFQGNHVFAGIRELVEEGVVDGERMPGWMTGEEGVSVGVVRGGRVRGWKGSGL